MLQIADKDRLDKVLAVIEKNKIRFPVADIHKKMGGSKGTISDYIKGNKPISENWYSTFLELFDKNNIKEVEGKTEPQNDKLSSLIESNHELCEANKALSIANKDLAAAHISLIRMLEVGNQPNSGNQQGISEFLEPYLNQLAAGLAGKSLKEESDVMREFRRILTGQLKNGIKLGK